MIYRRANAEELPLISQMQAEIFYKEQDVPLEISNEFLSNNPTCWCAVEDNKICGAVAAWKESDELHWGRFIVIPQLRGKHIGTQLAKCSFDDIFSSNAETIHMEARDTTVRIVCRMGGKITGAAAPFYKGNVTPVVLGKEAYEAAVAKA